MKPSFKLHEIDHHILKLIVGLIALMLANVTAYFSIEPLQSISASYHEGGWPRDFLVGSLFAISSFLFAYNGETLREMVLSKIAAVSALGVALFPCDCGTGNEIIRYVHYGSAAAMFIVLACFCWIFYGRALAKGHREAAWRSYIYAICGIAILAAVAVLALDFFTSEAISAKIPRLIFYGERAGLVAFGVSWLVASRVLPVITAKGERISVLPVSAS
jgi:hypothetical protein